MILSLAFGQAFAQATLRRSPSPPPGAPPRPPGGLAPDLRHLDKAEAGDEWFINRIRHGSQNEMPAFEGVLSQEAMWAIRTYLDARYDGS